MSYSEYLSSPHWKRTKEAFRKITKKRCFICREKEKIDLHHKRYELHGSSILGYERKNDLRWLCRKCHYSIHGLGLEKEFAQGRFKRTMYKNWFKKL